MAPSPSMAGDRRRVHAVGHVDPHRHAEQPPGAGQRAPVVAVRGGDQRARHALLDDLVHGVRGAQHLERGQAEPVGLVLDHHPPEAERARDLRQVPERRRRVVRQRAVERLRVADHARGAPPAPPVGEVVALRIHDLNGSSAEALAVTAALATGESRLRVGGVVHSPAGVEEVCASDIALSFRSRRPRRAASPRPSELALVHRAARRPPSTSDEETVVTSAAPTHQDLSHLRRPDRRDRRRDRAGGAPRSTAPAPSPRRASTPSPRPALLGAGERRPRSAAAVAASPTRRGRRAARRRVRVDRDGRADALRRGRRARGARPARRPREPSPRADHLSTLAFSEAGSRSHFWAPWAPRRARRRRWSGSTPGRAGSPRPARPTATSGRAGRWRGGPMTLWLVPADSAGPARGRRRSTALGPARQRARAR